MIARLLLVASLVTALLGLSGVATDSHASGRASTDALERLESAARAHPDDPDLVWALAMARSDAGEIDAAIRDLEGYARRWPDRREELHFVLGQLKLEVGDASEAVDRFDLALRDSPRSGALHFYRALGLRSLGRRIEASRALSAAQHYEPSLEPEVLLVRALDLISDGRDDAADRLLERILEIDPTGEAARRARLILLDRRPIDQTRWYRLDAYAGLEYDSNVTLASEIDVLPITTDESDIRGVFGAGLTLRPVKTRRFGLTGGFRYDQTVNRNLTAFDFVNNAGFLSGSWRFADRAAVRLDAVAFNTRLDGASYATVATLRPNFIYDFGRAVGTTRVFADVEWQRYQDTPTVPYFERDAEVYGAGIEHFHVLFRPEAWGSLAFRYERADTNAPITGQFGGDYDLNLYELKLRWHEPLPWRLDADGWLVFGYEDYLYNSYFAFAQSFSLVKRQDEVWNARIAVSRPIGRFVRLETAYYATDRSSNIQSFSYTRHIVGVYVRVATE